MPGKISSESVPALVSELGKTATQIALKNFEWQYMSLVLFNSTLCAIEVFLQSYQKITIIGKGAFYPKFVSHARQYVIFGVNVDNIVWILNWMENHQFDNTRKFIVICQSQDSCDETEAVKTLWTHKVTNVVFLKISDGVVAGYTYFPLCDSDCKTDVPVKLDLSSCFNAAQNSCSDMYSMKLTNLNKCPLIASTFKQPPYMYIEDGMLSGANGDLLVILAEAMNATLQVMTPRIGNGWGELKKSGNWSGSLADVYYDYANLSITSAALTLSRFSYFHMSIDYHTASVVWVTHPATMMPSSLKLTHPLQPSSQIAVSACFILVILCALIRRSSLWSYHGRVIEDSRPRSSIVFYSWMICMGLPSPRLPSKPAYTYIVLLWMWFCFFIRTIYQVSLITVLKANYYFGEFETIEDAINADYSFGGGAALRDYFIGDPDIYNKWTDLRTNDIIPTMRNLSKGVKFVLAMSMETAHTIISEEKINVHILPQKVITCPTVIFFKKYSPLSKSINGILSKLIESGISDKLKKIYSSNVKKNNTENTLEPININHYTGCYVVLITGWVISFLFFVGEMLFDKVGTTL